MIELRRVTSDNPDFHDLVKLLDQDLALRNGDANAFFTTFNKISLIPYVIVAYADQKAVGCGALKPYNTTTMEIKRMFVKKEYRGKGIAAAVLKELETWTQQLGYSFCILETGDKMPEALSLYKKMNYHIIPNYPPYETIESSICFEKTLIKN